MDKAIDILAQEPCDVFNHNLETVPRLYKQVRPGADYPVLWNCYASMVKPAANAY